MGWHVTDVIKNRNYAIPVGYHGYTKTYVADENPMAITLEIHRHMYDKTFIFISKEQAQTLIDELKEGIAMIEASDAQMRAAHLARKEKTAGG